MYSADRRMDQKRYNQTDGYCQGSKRRKNSKGKDRAKDNGAVSARRGNSYNRISSNSSHTTSSPYNKSFGKTSKGIEVGGWDRSKREAIEGTW